MATKTKSKRKFNDGEIVIDQSNSIIGVVAGYLGRGLYELNQLRAPIHNLHGAIQGYVLIDPEVLNLAFLGAPAVNGEIERKTYIQASRFLEKIDNGQLLAENEIDPKQGSIYITDGWENLLKVNKITVTYSGGALPVAYNAVFCLDARLVIHGSFEESRFDSVYSVPVNRNSNYRVPFGVFSSACKYLTEQEAQPALNWEEEFAPFIIQGRII